jgi:hypothetical protein
MLLLPYHMRVETMCVNQVKKQETHHVSNFLDPEGHGRPTGTYSCTR